MIKKNIIRGISFILLVSIALGCTSWLMKDKNTTLSCMYSEPDNTIDVVMIGSSHVNNGYIPNLLWEECSASAVNVFSWSQPMWISYHYLKETLKTQSPKIAVLDMFGMTYGHSYIMPQEIDKTNYNNSFNIDFGLNFLQMINTVEFCGLDLRNAEDFLPLVRYHTKWKNMDWKQALYNPHNDPDKLKGYGIATNVYMAEKPYFTSDIITEPYEYSILYLDKIVELCNENNIELVFTVIPYVFNEAEYGIYKWIENYANEKNITFLNYNGEDGERIGIDFNTDLSDKGHVNINGALKVTKDLCDYIELNYTFNKENNSNAVQLNKDYTYVQRVIEVQSILEAKDIESWLEQVIADDNMTLFIVDKEGNNNISDLLNSYGVECAEKCQSLIKSSKNIIVNAEKANYNLFGLDGEISFDYINNTILLNDTKVMLESDDILIVMYDEILERPLSCISYDDDFLQREFTSDILHLYK